MLIEIIFLDLYTYLHNDHDNQFFVIFEQMILFIRIFILIFILIITNKIICSFIVD